MGRYLDMAQETLSRMATHHQSYGEKSEKSEINESEFPPTRGIYEYKLTDSLSWLVLLAPGVDLNNARRTLEAQFGEDRLVEVRPKRGTCGELPCAKDL